MAKCSSVCVRNKNELQNSNSKLKFHREGLCKYKCPSWSIDWLTSIRQGFNSDENKNKLLCKFILENFPAPLNQWLSALNFLIMPIFAVVKLLLSMEISAPVPWSNLLLFYFYLENKTQTDFKYSTQVIDPTSGLYGVSLQSYNFCPPHNVTIKKKKKTKKKPRKK